MPKYHCIVRREKTEGCDFPWEQDLEGEVEASYSASAARIFAASFGTHQDFVPVVCDEIVEVTPITDGPSMRTRKYMIKAEVTAEWRVDHEIAP